jgi:hypothetical protein
VKERCWTKADTESAGQATTTSYPLASVG